MQSYTDLICQHCQKPFKALTKEVRRGRKYCKYDCSVPHRSGRPPKPLEERFWAQVKKTDHCWFWTGCIGSGGYGSIGMKGRKAVGAHIVSWNIANGEIPKGLQVCHDCRPNPDCKICVNPDHLWLGTCQENLADAVQKGITARGERNANARLNPEAVLKIRLLAEQKVSFAAISRMFNISQSAIRYVVIRKTWRHILESATSEAIS